MVRVRRLYSLNGNPTDEYGGWNVERIAGSSPFFMALRNGRL